MPHLNLDTARTVSWAAFDLGRVKARVGASRARQLESEARYAQAVLRALEEMETALARYRAARDGVGRIEEAASASERAAELARLRFSEGVADFLQVLDAERTQLETQDQLARARNEGRHDLCGALRGARRRVADGRCGIA